MVRPAWPGPRGGHSRPAGPPPSQGVRVGAGGPLTPTVTGAAAHTCLTHTEVPTCSQAYFVPRVQGRCRPNSTVDDCLQSWGRASESKCGQGCFLLRPLSLVADTAFSFVLTWPPSALSWGLSQKDASPLGSGPTPLTPSEVYHHPRGPVSKRPNVGGQGFTP